MEVYILDKNLKAIGIVDSFKSLIWANRYNEVGDCELYLPVGENISLLQIGNYLVRQDDEMVCRIDRIEIDTDAENGNYLIVNGTDVKGMLDQRIISGTADGNAEDFIRQMVTDSIINPSDAVRKMKKQNGDQLFYLDDSAGLTDAASEQINFANLGAKIREFCKNYNWGYRVKLRNEKFLFGIYEGTEKPVYFSNDYENLSSSKYSDDATRLGNVAIVAGAGEGDERESRTYGDSSGTDRHEIFVDSKDTARNITFQQLQELYPNGSVVAYHDIYGWQVVQIDIQILTDEQLTALEERYPYGEVVTIDGNDYFRIGNDVVAAFTENPPTDNTTVVLEDAIFTVYLLTKGQQAVAEYGETVTFDGSIIPDVTFIYKRDYYLGDIVKIKNEYNFSADVRITEVVEVWDDNGYRIEPKFIKEV